MFEKLKVHEIDQEEIERFTSVVMETDKGTMHIKLFPKEAPNTVANFATLIKDGYYDGLNFHRVIEDFVIQGGCPDGTGTGGPGWLIPCELKNNPHKHEAGSLSMAHAGPNTGGSQFFVCHSPQSHLDNMHTVFGKVSDDESMEVVMKIEPGDKMIKVTVGND